MRGCAHENMANNLMLKLPVISQANLLHQLALSLGTVIPSYSTKPVPSALRINKRVATKTMSFFEKEEKKSVKPYWASFPFFILLQQFYIQTFWGPTLFQSLPSLH